jgi:GxxExxY protein
MEKMNHKGHRGKLSTLKQKTDFPFSDITEKVISCAIEVHSNLGPGLLERLYEEALSHEFMLRGIVFERQKEIRLNYKGKDIGIHRIDFLVEDRVIIEIKATKDHHKIKE